jgi:hypothetical protein
MARLYCKVECTSLRKWFLPLPVRAGRLHDIRRDGGATTEPSEVEHHTTFVEPGGLTQDAPR